jgi:hypothetical protein
MMWENNLVQFARLLSEMNAVVDISSGELRRLAESMDLEPDQILELFDRAEAVWEDAKRNLGAGMPGVTNDNS